MKINFAAPILDIKGVQITEGENKFTLGFVVTSALLTPTDDEKNISAVEKIRRFKLAEIAVKAEEADIKVDDVTLIKVLVNKVCSVLVTGRVFELIEPSTE